MSRFDDLWSKTAETQLHDLPVGVRDQVEAMIRDVCAEPTAYPEAHGLRRTRVARVERTTVLFQVDELDQLVYVIGVDWRE